MTKAILEAATREFAENGMGGARVDAIAERAGTNKRMLYHYFGDKEQLYLRVLEEAYVGIRTAERALHIGDRRLDDAETLCARCGRLRGQDANGRQPEGKQQQELAARGRHCSPVRK